MKNRATYKIIVERVFPEKGKTLEELYLDYMAEKIAELVREMQKEAEPITNTVWV